MTASITEIQDTRSVVELPCTGAQVTDLDVVRSVRAASAQQRRSAARSRDLTALLRDRPDLVGVHAPADFAVDGVRWCV